MPRFYRCAGIESPGLTSAPAIGEMVADMLEREIDPEEKENFVSTEKAFWIRNTLTLEERNELIKKSRHTEILSAVVR